jgi:rhodanese-related sulfurtransferase
MRFSALCGVALLCEALATARAAAAPEWIRAATDTDGPSWGIRDGLVWGIPAGLRPTGGPRGLIRLRYPTLPEGKLDLINFIAVEPIVGGVRGYSELERSRPDDAPGLRLTAENPPVTEKDAERLTVTVRVEKFANGAHVALAVTQRLSAPDEIELAISAEPDSAPLEYCILTATMGNKARTRLLWRKDETVSSLKLYPDYKEDGFAPHAIFNLDRLARTAAGEVLVYCQVGLCGYLACRILSQRGFPCRNLSGGYRTYAAAIIQ